MVHRRGYQHHGLYAGAGQVIHYAGLACGFRSGTVEEISIEQFAAGRRVRCLDGPACFTGDEVVRRARLRLGEDRYRLLTNNCEHFCEWARHGRSRSRQIERWTGLGVWRLLLAATAAWLPGPQHPAVPVRELRRQ